jgi:hypothetical protein
VMASWLIERVPSAPLIWVIVPPTESCAALSQVLCLLCRHALPSSVTYRRTSTLNRSSSFYVEVIHDREE